MHIKLRDNVEENLRQTVVSRRNDIYSPLLKMIKITCYFNNACTEEYIFIILQKNNR